VDSRRRAAAGVRILMDVNGDSRSSVDVTRFVNPFSRTHKLVRVAWGLVWLLLFRPSPRLAFGWRCFLLRRFGAELGAGVHVYPSCRVWAPWNLEMGDHAGFGPNVDCYCVDKVRVGPHATVSQYAYLCTASHDISDPAMRLVTAPITIGASAWVAAGAFVGPGVSIGEGAVVAARAVVVKDVEAWLVVGGNPAKCIKKRELRAT
jgi:putative colanic acid biosynthesis acetyltransferase WcaF